MLYCVKNSCPSQGVVLVFWSCLVHFCRLLVRVIVSSLCFNILVFNLLQDASDVIVPFERSVGHTEVDLGVFFHVWVAHLLGDFHGAIEMLG